MTAIDDRAGVPTSCAPSSAEAVVSGVGEQAVAMSSRTCAAWRRKLRMVLLSELIWLSGVSAGSCALVVVSVTGVVVAVAGILDVGFGIFDSDKIAFGVTIGGAAAAGDVALAAPPADEDATEPNDKRGIRERGVAGVCDAGSVTVLPTAAAGAEPDGPLLAAEKFRTTSFSLRTSAERGVYRGSFDSGTFLSEEAGTGISTARLGPDALPWSVSWASRGTGDGDDATVSRDKSGALTAGVVATEVDLGVRPVFGAVAIVACEAAAAGL